MIAKKAKDRKMSHTGIFRQNILKLVSINYFFNYFVKKKNEEKIYFKINYYYSTDILNRLQIVKFKDNTLDDNNIILTMLNIERSKKEKKMCQKVFFSIDTIINIYFCNF